MTKLKWPLLAAAVATWAFLLWGFVSGPALFVLSILGPALAWGGLALAAGSLRRMIDAPGHALGLLLALVMVAAAAATLAPQVPDSILASTATGWEVLEARAIRLETAVRERRVWLAGRLARRGVGDPAPLGAGGRPLLHDVQDPRLLAVLLEAGFDPDARDAEGATLLMHTRDLGLTRLLLAAGADPNARRRGGSTPLMAGFNKEPALIQALLDAGADPHAVDEAGRSVASHLPPDGPIRELLEARAGGRPLQDTDGAALAGARTDWLEVVRDPGAALAESAVRLRRQPLRPGDEARLDLVVANPSALDRRVTVEAVLNGAALFVAASHGGTIPTPDRPGLAQTVRWPALALPAHSQGRLELQVLVPADGEAGDLEAVIHVRLGSDPRPLASTLRAAVEPAAPPAGPASLWWAGALVLPAAGMVWAVRRTRRSVRRGRTAALVAALAGGATAAAALAFSWTLAEPWVAFEETTCTVLDRRLRLDWSDPSAEHSGAGYSTDSPRRVSSLPVVAVRIDRDAGPVVATGFSTGFALRSSAELRRFPLGARVPCWVDPDQAERFTLERRPSLGGALGIASLGALTVLLGFVASRAAPPR